MTPSIPVMLIARNVGVIAVNNDQPWKTLGDLFADAKKNPGQIKMGSTGPGGLPHVVSSLMKATSGVDFNHIVFGGAGPAVTALLGGHVQMTVLGMAECREHLRAGRIRALAVVSEVPVPEIKDVPLITATSADYKKYLPWGPFYGVFVKKETPGCDEEDPRGCVPERGQRSQAAGSSSRTSAPSIWAFPAPKRKHSLRNGSPSRPGLSRMRGRRSSPPEKFGIPKP